MSARLIIGDVRRALELVPDGSVDLVVTSPPFFLQRAYLPDDHPDKALEIGLEDDPGEFIDAQLEVIELCAMKIAPHGSLVWELGDTYGGSGGAGGDYAPGGLREGQPKFKGTAAKKPRSTRPKYAGGPIGKDRSGDIIPTFPHSRREAPGLPLDKSVCCIPDLLKIALAYGVNPLTGRSTPKWLVRNDIVWCKPNPSPGDEGDKFRPATERAIVATKSARRYWGGDLVRVPSKSDARRAASVEHSRRRIPGQPDHVTAPLDGDGFRMESNPLGRPLYDWWEIATQPTKSAHYATWPEALVTPMVLSMCPERVCLECGQPSVPVIESQTMGVGFTRARDARRSGGPSGHGEFAGGNRVLLGWSDCGHDSWRRGVVLDPFAGSGTTLQVATRLNRDAIGIDLDERNYALIQERVGMFLTDVEYLAAVAS